jgi:uncharacterized protein involved in exopolysaccharide biosynthesis/Mrp family chromosome partitioning ATPase
MIIVVTALALAGALAFVTTAQVKYTSSATILVENRATPFTQVQPTTQVEPPIVERDVNTQIEVLNSRDLAADVIDRRISDAARLALAQKKKAGLADKLLARVGLQTDSIKMTERQRALDNYLESLVVYAVNRSSVIKIEYTATDPKIAAQIANAVAQAYLEATQSAQAEPISDAREWLAGQIDALREKVVQSEVAVEEYRAQAGLLQGANAATLNNQELSELNSQIILAAAAKSEAAARAKSIRDMLATTGTIDAASDVINSPLIQRLREQQVRMRRRLAELSTTYLDNHPRIIGARRELNDLNKQVRSEALKIVQGLEQQAKIAASREAELRKNLNELKSQASVKNVDEVKLRALQREADANRTLLETFLTRYNEASAREKSTAQPGMARIISTAVAPLKPSFPKKGPIILLATLAGLVLALGLAFLLEVMKAASRMQQAASAAPVPAAVAAPATQAMPMPPAMPQAPPPVPTASAVPPVAMQAAAAGTALLTKVPASPDANTAATRARGIVDGTAADYDAAVRPITRWMQGVSRLGDVKRIAVTSLPGAELDGATTALSAGRQLSAGDVRVVLLDCDGENRLAARLSGVHAGSGLTELAANEATFSDVIRNDPASSLHIISFSARPAGTAPALDKPRLEMVLDALGHAYDLVLINTGKAEFPADKSQVALTACHAALVVAQDEFAGPAQTLCDALTQSGMQAASYALLDAPANAALDQRIAAAVS